MRNGSWVSSAKEAAKSLPARSGAAIENWQSVVYNARRFRAINHVTEAKECHAGTVAVGQAVRGGIELRF